MGVGTCMLSPALRHQSRPSVRSPNLIWRPLKTCVSLEARGSGLIGFRTSGSFTCLRCHSGSTPRDCMCFRGSEGSEPRLFACVQSSLGSEPRDFMCLRGSKGLEHRDFTCFRGSQGSEPGISYGFEAARLDVSSSLRVFGALGA